jgi:transposase InsO family protein
LTERRRRHDIGFKRQAVALASLAYAPGAARARLPLRTPPGSPIDACHGVVAQRTRGNCYDNAHMESFFANLKLEMGQYFGSASDAVDQIRDYIQFYNTTRLHSSLNYCSPIAYERRDS